MQNTNSFLDPKDFRIFSKIPGRRFFTGTCKELPIPEGKVLALKFGTLPESARAFLKREDAL